MSRQCSLFSTDVDPDEWVPCRCPACQGFLPNDFPLGEQFLCKKCGAVLETLPSLVEDPDYEEDTDYEYGGRICLVPKIAIKISTELPPKTKKHRKKGTDLWAVGVGFSRKVWEDEAGRFITIGSERLNLDDPRILNTYETEVE